jgi:hypothetical protein
MPYPTLFQTKHVMTIVTEEEKTVSAKIQFQTSEF